MINKTKILTFGEIMLRLTSPEYNTIEEAHHFIANYGGGEANVAVSLSRFGHDTYFISRLPNNQLGDSAIKHLKGNGVNTSFVDRGGSNIGIYFLESGFGGRPSKVIYNRKYAAITSIHIEKFDLKEIFQDAKWFHFSGINLALGQQVVDVLLQFLEACKQYGVMISFDCNYRKTLWQEIDPKPFYTKVMPYVDVCFTSPFDAINLFGITSSETIKEKIDTELLTQLMDTYQIKYLFGTKRTIYTATDNALGAYVMTSKETHEVSPIRFNIYDRIGGGDAFAAGIIHGLLNKEEDLEFVLKFGLATSVLKHTIWGDSLNLYEKDVLNYMQNESGKVIR